MVGTWALVFSSFFMSLMFPTIFTIAIRGLDKQQTQLGSSLIVMAIIGGATLTPMMVRPGRAIGHQPASCNNLLPPLTYSWPLLASR